METNIVTPQLTIVSGPMGGGKSGANKAVINTLREADLRGWGRERAMSISETSRPVQRPGEEGDYIFDVPEERFAHAVETGDLMEMVRHPGGYYGSPTPPEGQPTHLEIEVTGVSQILASTHPRVVQARVGMKAVYLLQSSMGDLFRQIMGRDDGMSEEKKKQRIARYPAEIGYILNQDLPYGFVLNPSGRPEVMMKNVAFYMLGDRRAILESRRIAESKAAEAYLWLKNREIEPVRIGD